MHNGMWVDLLPASGFNLTGSYGVEIRMNDQSSKYTDAYSLLQIASSYAL
jgi:hypothetical protein